MRCAVVSDIHANLEALEAVLSDAVDVDQLWCLGDIVDGGPEPNECLALLRARGALCIFGNHEGWVLEANPLKAWSCWTNEHLSQDNLAFLKALPEQVAIGEFTLLHYPHAGLEPPVADDVTRFASRYCLIGHTHLPLVCRYTTHEAGQTSVEINRGSPDETINLDMERAIVNVGSVGSSLSHPYRACYVSAIA